MTRPLQSIHPFPARMAPELSRDLIRQLPVGSRVLDPMCGSGTVVRQAVEAGHTCVGRDIDPLAVLMASAWTTSVPTFRVAHDALEIIKRARAIEASAVERPWVDDETEAFAQYWFAPQQLDELSRLAMALKTSRYASRDLLKISFSRLIITKDRGASLARDVSHSRPHRVATESDFDVYEGFVKAARLVARRLDPEQLRGTATVELGDARELAAGGSPLFDAAMTSPPYLNAIDYLRGHRLALIWFGYSVADLRRIRSGSTGSERAVAETPFDVDPFIEARGEVALPDRYRGWVRRYATDMSETLSGLRSVVRPGGKIMLVVGNSVIRGSAINNAGIISRCAQREGLAVVDSRERLIPSRRRYLPTPSDDSALGQRMRSEFVLTFGVPAAA